MEKYVSRTPKSRKGKTTKTSSTTSKTRSLQAAVDAVREALGDLHEDTVKAKAEEMRSMSREANVIRVAFGRLVVEEVDHAKVTKESTAAEVRATWADLLNVSDSEIRRMMGVTRKLLKLAKTTPWSKIEETILDGSWGGAPVRAREALGIPRPPRPTYSWATKSKTRARKLAKTIEREAQTPAELREAVAALRAEADRLNKLAKEMEQAQEEQAQEAPQEAEEPEVEVEEAQEPTEEQETPQEAQEVQEPEVEVEEQYTPQEAEEDDFEEDDFEEDDSKEPTSLEKLRAQYPTPKGFPPEALDLIVNAITEADTAFLSTKEIGERVCATMRWPKIDGRAVHASCKRLGLSPLHHGDGRREWMNLRAAMAG